MLLTLFAICCIQCLSLALLLLLLPSLLHTYQHIYIHKYIYLYIFQQFVTCTWARACLCACAICCRGTHDLVMALDSDLSFDSLDVPSPPPMLTPISSLLGRQRKSQGRYFTCELQVSEKLCAHVAS